MCYIMTANGFTLLTSEERDKLYGISSKDNKNKKRMNYEEVNLNDSENRVL